MFTKFPLWNRWFGPRRTDPAQRAPRRPHWCRIEEFEDRRLMATDLMVGSVYYEQASGDDLQPNMLQFTFEGGAPGTQLTRIVIDGDKDGKGISAGDVFFDTAPGGYGVFRSNPLKIISHDGFQVLSTQVTDGGMKLVIDLAGFEAGETLVLSIDVDEFQYVDEETGDIDVNAVAEGAEFQRSKFITTFVAPHYEDLTKSVLFWDAFNQNFSSAESQTGLKLKLPPDRYSTQLDLSDLTAGAVATAEQIPLPNSLSGVVYLDHNLNNKQDTGDPGLAGVHLALLKWDGAKYVATGLTTVTDTLGNYKFDDLEIGKFRVVETQPGGYLSVGATPGKVGGVTRGVVTTSDILSEIELLGGENSVRNDFAEYLPASISGYVHVSDTGDCKTDPTARPLEGVTIELLNSAGTVIATTVTDAKGYYVFDTLRPGTYSVREVQPEDYYDGLEYVGSAGGTLSDDLISNIKLGSGVDAVKYIFCETTPKSISGYVHVSDTGDCVNDPTAKPLSGVTIELLDATGKVIGTTQTNAQGYYLFDDLAPGTYGVREVQPAGYLDGMEYVGTVGGQLSDDLITNIQLVGANGELYNFCEMLPVSISGYVHVSDTGDCVNDPTAKPLSGVTIHLLDSAGHIIGTTQTNGQGFYKFANLAPGTYSVREVQPAGYLDGMEYVGSAGGALSDDFISNIVLAGGVDAVKYNFCELLSAGISGYVYLDLNNDGIKDPGESGLGGVTVYLKDANGQPTGATAVTNAVGYYEFTGLRPGTYGVGEIQPAGYFDGLDTAGSAGGAAMNPGDMIMGAVLTGGLHAIDYNFGELPPASLSGFVHVSDTGDCMTDPSAKPLAGVTIQLLDADGNVVATATTNAAGNYHFDNLAPGTYGVREIQPAGYLDGLEYVGSAGGNLFDDLITEIVLGAGVNAVKYGFCEQLPPPPPPEPPQVIFPPQFEPPVPPPVPAFYNPPLPIPPLLNPELPFLILRQLTRAGGQLYTWHLSVVDAGFPRGALPGESAVQFTAFKPEDQILWSDEEMDDVEWTILVWVDDQPVTRKLRFGMRGGIPISGDFNGDGTFEVGVFKDGYWFVDLNGNGVWDTGDLWAKLGHDGDKPVTGDWDGDGKTDIGIYGPAWSGDPRAIAHEPGLPDPHNEIKAQHKNIPRPAEKNAVGHRTLKRTSDGRPRSDLIDHVFLYGTPGDHPIVGDWNGDGIDTIGVFRDGVWRRDADGDGRSSQRDDSYRFGQHGDKPLAADFDGDGIEELAIFRDGTWYIDSNGNGVIDRDDRVIQLGEAGDLPVVGDWDGDGRAEPGVYHDNGQQRRAG